MRVPRIVAIGVGRAGLQLVGSLPLVRRARLAGESGGTRCSDPSGSFNHFQ